MKNQRGGTFLGIILGVVFGLAVALGVAIYVAKVPVPFVNKGASRSSGQDAAEAEKNKDWDPNAPLRGKSSAPAANGTVGSVAPPPAGVPIPSPAEADHSAAAKPPVAVPTPAEVKRTPDKAAAAASASAPARGKPSDDPLGDFAAARTGRATQVTPAPAPAPAAAPAADPSTYFVQAGAFRTPEDAEGQRARLSLIGVEARVTEREQAGRTVYRVRVGPFQNKDAADRVKERLAGNGLDAALVRVAR